MPLTKSIYKLDWPSNGAGALNLLCQPVQNYVAARYIGRANHIILVVSCVLCASFSAIVSDWQLNSVCMFDMERRLLFSHIYRTEICNVLRNSGEWSVVFVLFLSTCRWNYNIRHLGCFGWLATLIHGRNVSLFVFSFYWFAISEQRLVLDLLIRPSIRYKTGLVWRVKSITFLYISRTSICVFLW